MKSCPRCGSEGPFGKNTSQPDGLGSYCRKCVAEITKQKYEKLKSEGRCVRCGAKDVEMRGVKCIGCIAIEKQKREGRAATNSYVAPDPERKCSRCGSRGPFGKNRTHPDGLNYYCRVCENDKSREWYLKHKAEGRCANCGAPGQWQGVNCDMCASSFRNKRLARRQSGVCPQCARPVLSGYVYCSLCVGRKRERRRERRDSGLCVRCGVKSVIGPRCVKHAAAQVWKNSKLASKRKGHEPIVLPLEEFIRWYTEHFDRADGNCEWCGTALALDNAEPKTDHDHETGVPRALVCGSCNTLEGHYRSYGVERFKKVVAVLDTFYVQKKASA